MGHPHCECSVFIFCHHWWGYRAGEYQDVSKDSAQICSFQAFPPANIIFTGIGVLLLVGVLRGSLVQPILISMAPRRLKIPALAKTSLLTSSTASNISSAGLKFTL